VSSRVHPFHFDPTFFLRGVALHAFCSANWVFFSWRRFFSVSWDLIAVLSCVHSGGCEPREHPLRH
jgi:hypothetical protein